MASTSAVVADRKQAIEESLVALIGKQDAKLAIKGKGFVDVSRAEWM